MKWSQIKEDCPKSFKLMANSGYVKGVINRMIIRDLYDFFDENGVFITISVDYYGINEHNPLQYSGDTGDVYYWINVNWVYEDNVEYRTRTEAEQFAFTKAFEILENKLKNDK